MNKKYSTEFKLKVVQEYQKGEKGSQILGHKMNIHPSMVLSWYHLYKQHGINGLRNRAEISATKKNASSLLGKFSNYILK